MRHVIPVCGTTCRLGRLCSVHRNVHCCPLTGPNAAEFIRTITTTKPESFQCARVSVVRCPLPLDRHLDSLLFTYQLDNIFFFLSGRDIQLSSSSVCVCDSSDWGQYNYGITARVWLRCHNVDGMNGKEIAMRHIFGTQHRSLPVCVCVRVNVVSVCEHVWPHPVSAIRFVSF